MVTRRYLHALNYLAHAYLSFGQPGILAGNMISDYVKGRKKFEYPAVVLKGINLHRFIDTFTDSHEATRAGKEIFRTSYRLYSGAIMDVIYDHFLANDKREFQEDALSLFAKATYANLDQYTDIMPERFLKMYPYMKEQDWLSGYSQRIGIRHSLQGLARRARYLQESDTAFALFEQHYQLLEDCYRHFWAFAKPAVYKEYQLLMNDEKTENSSAEQP